MPHYRAPDGSRYYFAAAPAPGDLRADLVLMTAAEVAAADAVPLADAKVARKAEVNALRTTRENSIAPTPKGLVQCDLASQSKINGAVLMALLAMQTGRPFAVAWTMANNSDVTHDAPEIIAMGQAVGGFVAACHEHGGALKKAIDAASDFAALDAIDIAAGWP